MREDLEGFSELGLPFWGFKEGLERDYGLGCKGLREGLGFREVFELFGIIQSLSRAPHIKRCPTPFTSRCSMHRPRHFYWCVCTLKPKLYTQASKET